VVSVTSLLADERIYYPVDFEPYTPSHHFEGGKNDRAFRTKLKIAAQLVEVALVRSIPFRAVVADSFYGEDRGFKGALEELGAPYVLALKPSHAWWHMMPSSTCSGAAAPGGCWRAARS
jgi:SRSO17 transposase